MWKKKFTLHFLIHTIFLSLLSPWLFICLSCSPFSFSQICCSVFMLSFSPFVSGCQWTFLHLFVFLFASLTSRSANVSLCLPLTRAPSHFLPHLSFSPTTGPSLPIAGPISAAADPAVTLRLFILKALGGGHACAIFFVTSLRRCDIRHSVVIKRLTVSLGNTLALAVAFVLSPALM